MWTRFANWTADLQGDSLDAHSIGLHDDAHGLDAEDLWYLSLKVKIKGAYSSGGVFVISSKGERTEPSLSISHTPCSLGPGWAFDK